MEVRVEETPLIKVSQPPEDLQNAVRVLMPKSKKNRRSKETKPQRRWRQRRVIKIKSQDKSNETSVEKRMQLTVDTNLAKKVEKADRAAEIKNTEVFENPLLSISPDRSGDFLIQTPPIRPSLIKAHSAQPKINEEDHELNEFSLLSEHSFCLPSMGLDMPPLPKAPRASKAKSKLTSLKIIKSKNELTVKSPIEDMSDSELFMLSDMSSKLYTPDSLGRKINRFIN